MYRAKVFSAVRPQYEALLACYLSGQVSEPQWQEHLKDEVFSAWVKARSQRR